MPENDTPYPISPLEVLEAVIRALAAGARDLGWVLDQLPKSDESGSPLLWAWEKIERSYITAEATLLEANACLDEVFDLLNDSEDGTFNEDLFATALERVVTKTSKTLSTALDAADDVQHILRPAGA